MIDETKEGEKNHPTIAEAQADAQSEAGERMAQIDRFEKQEREKFEKWWNSSTDSLVKEGMWQAWLERAKMGEEEMEKLKSRIKDVEEILKYAIVKKEER